MRTSKNKEQLHYRTHVNVKRAFQPIRELKKKEAHAISASSPSVESGLNKSERAFSSNLPFLKLSPSELKGPPNK